MSQPSLARQLTVVSATALVVSNMIGVGIFTTTGFLAGDLGQPWLVVGIWLVGAILALAGALCYSELAVNFPRSGGEYVYLTEAWGPTWGFVNGWVSFFAGFSAPIAAAVLAICAYLAVFFPSLSSDAPAAFSVPLGIATLELGALEAVACAIVLAFTVVNVLGAAQVAALQNVLTATKLIVLAGFLVLGFAIGNGDWAHFSETLPRAGSTPLFGQFAVSLVFVFYGYSGWNAAVYVAEEIRDPGRTLPLALVSGTVFVALFYVALNVLYIYASPLSELAGVLAVGATAATALFGDQVGGVFAAAMALSLLATVNAMSMIGPRVYYAMAQNGAFFSAAGRLHPRWNSPWIAVIAQGLCCCALIVTGTFESLAYYIGFTLFFFTALAVLALFKFRQRPGWQKSPWVSLAYPVIPLAYVLMNLWVLIYFGSARQLEAIWAVITVLAGAAVYRFYVQPRTTADR